MRSSGKHVKSKLIGLKSEFDILKNNVYDLPNQIAHNWISGSAGRTSPRPSSGSLPLFCQREIFLSPLQSRFIKKRKNIHNKTLNLRLFYRICMSLHWHGAKVYTLLKNASLWRSLKEIIGSFNLCLLPKWQLDISCNKCCITLRLRF